MTVSMSVAFVCLIAVFLLFLATFWFSRMVALMATKDQLMPGKHDKVLWVLLFLVVPFFAPFLYDAVVKRCIDDSGS